MNRTEYINELEKRLKYIPKEDRDDAVEYYTELISDMGLDETGDVEQKLGSPKDAAKKILDECTQKHVDQYEEHKTVKGHATVVWLSILGILSLPLSLPLGIAVLAIAFALIVVVISLLIAFAAAAVSLVFGGLSCFVIMWMAHGLAQKAVIFGSGLCSLALGILMCFGVYYLVRLMIRKIFRKNKSKEIKQ